MASSTSEAHGLLLRPAEERDLAAVEDCVHAAYGPYLERIGTQPAPLFADYGQAIREQRVVIACTADGAAGVLVCAVNESGFLLENVAVHPHFQGRGIGRALIAHAEDKAIAAGHDAITLYTQEKMVDNRQLYEKLGFVPIRRVHEHGYDRVYMRKLLA